MSDLYIKAEAFISSMQEFDENKSNSKKYSKRLKEIKKSIDLEGSYDHTFEELSFGAKLAWRNSNRCIGRHFWKKLKVFDCRLQNSKEDIYKSLEKHLKYSYNNGSLRSTITIFPKKSLSGNEPVRILNHQIIRYAGFSEKNKSILGDPHSVKFTKLALEKKWEPFKKTAFTPLPWIIEIDGKQQEPYDVFRLKPNLLKEIVLEHPENKKFKLLGIKWYPTPILADMALVIGGIIYPCAPFNGWYMETEIGARNLADQNRYNLLPSIAKLFKLDTSDDRTLWRDQSLVELNKAVLYSFDRDGVTIGDHHKLTKQFEKFCKNESKEQRDITGDWTWLIPPLSPSQTPTFSQNFDPTIIDHTNFFYQDSKIEKKAKCPFHLN